ncbi:hypothetical protein GCM10017673_14030 [Streptosporangium violaceochromogenes]|nr:hypothetical protein GCM10017673_14030 [Streptosporangium violaceochromogenes]
MLFRRRSRPRPGRALIRNPILFESDPDIPEVLKGRLNGYAKLRGAEGFGDAPQSTSLAAEIRADWLTAGLEMLYLDAILTVLHYQVVIENFSEHGDRLEADQRLRSFWVAHGMDKEMLRKIINRIDLNLLSIIDG